MENYQWQANLNDPGPPLGSQSYDSYVQFDGSMEKIYNYRPPIPQSAEEVSDQILDKLEQAGRVPSKEKFRRMACNTFVYTGACPYNDRCVFLHDYRVKAEGVKVRTTRQTKSNSNIKDTFYWPDMTRKDVIRNTDTQGLPTANQIYLIPEAFKGNPSNFHNRGLYSVWAHFVEFCAQNSIFYTKKYRDISSEGFFQMSSYKENPHVLGAKRLEVFIRLSLGYTFRKDGSIDSTNTSLLLRGVTHMQESGFDVTETTKLRLQRELPIPGEMQIPPRASPKLLPPGQTPSTPLIQDLSPKHFLPSDWIESNEEKLQSAVSDDNRTIMMFPKPTEKPVARRSFMDIPSVGSFTKLPNQMASNVVESDTSFQTMKNNKGAPNTLDSMTDDLYDSFLKINKPMNAPQLPKQITFDIPSRDLMSSMDVGVSGTFGASTIASEEGISPSLSFSYDSMYHPHDQYYEPDSIIHNQYSYDWQKSFDELETENEAEEVAQEAKYDEQISKSLESTAETIHTATATNRNTMLNAETTYHSAFDFEQSNEEGDDQHAPSSSASTMLPWTHSKRDEHSYSFDSTTTEEEEEHDLSDRKQEDSAVDSTQMSTFLRSYKEKESNYSIDDLWGNGNCLEKLHEEQHRTPPPPPEASLVLELEEGAIVETIPALSNKSTTSTTQDKTKVDSILQQLVSPVATTSYLPTPVDTTTQKQQRNEAITFGDFSPWSANNGNQAPSMTPVSLAVSSSQATYGFSPSTTIVPTNNNREIPSLFPASTASTGSMMSKKDMDMNQYSFFTNVSMRNEQQQQQPAPSNAIPSEGQRGGGRSLYSILPPEEDEDEPPAVSTSASEFLILKESNKIFQTHNHESHEEWDTFRGAAHGTQQSLKYPPVSFGMTSAAMGSMNKPSFSTASLTTSTASSSSIGSSWPPSMIKQPSPTASFGGLNIVGPTNTGNTPTATSSYSFFPPSSTTSSHFPSLPSPSSSSFPSAGADATGAISFARDNSNRPSSSASGGSGGSGGYFTSPMNTYNPPTAPTAGTLPKQPQYSNYQQPQQQQQQIPSSFPSYQPPPPPQQQQQIQQKASSFAPSYNISFDGATPPPSTNNVSYGYPSGGGGGGGMNSIGGYGNGGGMYQPIPTPPSTTSGPTSSGTYDRRRNFTVPQQSMHSMNTLPPRPSYNTQLSSSNMGYPTTSGSGTGSGNTAMMMNRNDYSPQQQPYQYQGGFQGGGGGQYNYPKASSQYGGMLSSSDNNNQLPSYFPSQPQLQPQHQQQQQQQQQSYGSRMSNTQQMQHQPPSLLPFSSPQQQPPTLNPYASQYAFPTTTAATATTNNSNMNIMGTTAGNGKSAGNNYYHTPSPATATAATAATTSSSYYHPSTSAPTTYTRYQ